MLKTPGELIIHDSFPGLESKFVQHNITHKILMRGTSLKAPKRLRHYKISFVALGLPITLLSILLTQAQHGKPVTKDIGFSS